MVAEYRDVDGPAAHRLAWGDRVTFRTGFGRDAKLLMAGQCARALGYGFTAVLLGALLAARGFSSLEAGGVLTAVIAGSALASLLVGRFGDRFGRRRSYALFFAGVAVVGVVVAVGAPLWVLLLVALSGALSTDVIDNGPATTLEQAMLAAEDAGTGIRLRLVQRDRLGSRCSWFARCRPAWAGRRRDVECSARMVFLRPGPRRSRRHARSRSPVHVS